MAERPITEEVILSIKANYQSAIEGIAKYNQKIDELKAKQKQLKEDVKAGTITEHEYQKAMAASKEEMKVYKEGARVLGKEIQNNVRYEKEQQTSLVALRSQLSNLTRSYDLLTKAERQGAKGKELQRHINEITKEIKDAEEATSRFYRNVGNYENAIKNALGLNNSFANSILAMKDAGNGNIMQGAVTSVRAFGASLTSLLSNPAFLALAGIVGVGAAFKWFYDYNKGIAEATRLTREFTGLTGPALEDIRNSIQATADTFGKEYLETLRAVDALMAQYHLSASDALKVINDGFVAGADLSGNFLSQLQQYAPAFHDAGIAADEMVAIIAQTRSGIFSEGGLDLIQTASKRIREMSKNMQESLDAIGISAQQVEKDLQSGTKSTFDVIQEISAKLKEFPQDSQEVGNVLKDVFGKTASNEGLQMIETLDTMTTKMEDVKKVTGEYGEMQEEQIAASKELNDVMSALFDQSQNGFETMIGQVRILATRWLTSAIKKVIEFVNYIIDLYNNTMMFRAAVQAVVMNFKTLWAAAKLVFNNLIEAVKGAAKPFLGLAHMIEGAFTLSWDKIKTGFIEATTAIPNAFRNQMSNIGKFGGEAWDNFKSGWDKAINNKPLKHIEISTGAGESTSDYVAPARGSGSGTASTSGSNDKLKKAEEKAAKERARAAEKAAKDMADAMKKENEAVKRAEELLLQLIGESYEKQRQAVVQSYDHRIADVKIKLTTEKNLTETAVRALNEQIVTLEKLKQRDLDRLSDEQMRKRIENTNKEIAMYLAAVRKGSLDEYNMKQQLLQNNQKVEESDVSRMVADEETKQEMLAAIRVKYAQQQKELNDELSKAEEEALRRRYELKMAAAKVDENDPNPEVTQMRVEMEMRKALLDEAHQMETESEEEFLLRKLQLQAEYNDAKEQLADKELAIETGKAQAIASTFGALSDIMGAFGDDSKSAAKASKVLALAEIAINTGVAIAEGVKQAQKVPFPGNIAAIATTIAAVLANITTAIKTVKSAKFAKGGLVQGEGTGTSDSVPAMLSNGESVMTAQATQMFAPVLSVMNQLGGGVPIPGNGMSVEADYLTKAVEEGVKKMPRPVVAVEEISNVRNRVEVIESLREI